MGRGGLLRGFSGTLSEKTAISEEKVSEEKETGRIEAFSDGVFAVAITLLALDIKVPPVDSVGPGALGWTLLRGQWPTLLAYVTSFLTILVMWLNHDRLYEHITRKDRLLMLYNGLLLMTVTLFPFPTALLAEYLRHPGENAKIAAAVYSGFSIVMAICFQLLWRHASANGRLLRQDHDRHRARRITEQYRFGPLLYSIAFVFAFISVPLCVGLNLALAVFFALPEKPPKEPDSIA